MPSLKDAYKSFGNIWKHYWTIYGGWKSLIRSPYMHIAVFISTVLCFPVWGKHHDDWAWYTLSIEILPNMLGFTLGGYAMLLAFGESKFLECIAGKDKNETSSPFMDINAAFLHFILMQIISLAIALTAMGWEVENRLLGWVGFSLFVYSLSTAAAAAQAIFRLANWYDTFVCDEKKAACEKDQ